MFRAIHDDIEAGTILAAEDAVFSYDSSNLANLCTGMDCYLEKFVDANIRDPSTGTGYLMEKGKLYYLKSYTYRQSTVPSPINWKADGALPISGDRSDLRFIGRTIPYLDDTANGYAWLTIWIVYMPTNYLSDVGYTATFGVVDAADDSVTEFAIEFKCTDCVNTATAGVTAMWANEPSMETIYSVPADAK